MDMFVGWSRTLMELRMILRWLASGTEAKLNQWSWLSGSGMGRCR
jgi:hypothetical protein